VGSEVAGGNWGRLKLKAPSSPDSTGSPNISVYRYFNVTSKSNTVRTIDLTTSWAPRRNSTKTSAPSRSRSLCYPPHHPFGIGWHYYYLQQSHTGAFEGLGLDSQRAKKLASKLHMHSVKHTAKLVHTRRALSSTVINFHQEPVSGQACNPPDPHWLFLSFSRWRSFMVLGTKVAPFP